MLRQYPRFLLVLILLSLSAYAQAAAHTIKESGVPTSSDGVVNWLDNQRVLFAGQKKNTSSGSPIEYELSVWNTATGSVSPYSGLQGTARVCIRGNFISYIRPKPGAEEWLLVHGKIQDGQIVEEELRALPSQYQMNPFSCRYYASPSSVEGQRTCNDSIVGRGRLRRLGTCGW